MANVCHGQGNLDSDGCCYVEGGVCPIRWKIVNGRVLEGPALTDIGTVASAVQSRIGGSKTVRDRIAAAIGQRVFVCRLAARYEGNWDSVHADQEYQTKVRPSWSKIEQINNLPANSYNCGVWGPLTGQCCYGETAVVNAAKAAWLTAVPVRIDIGKKAQQ